MTEPPFGLSYREYINACRARYLRRVLRATGGKVTRAAELAGVNRTYFAKLLSQHLPDRQKRRRPGGNGACRVLAKWLQCASGAASQ